MDEQPQQMVACDHADRCGGCPAIHLPYVDQLAQKRARVVQALARYPALELVYSEPVLPATSITHYRTRAKLIVGTGGSVGLFARGGGHDVVDVPECKVLSPTIAEVVRGVRARTKHDASTGGPLSPRTLRAVDVREVRDGQGAQAALLTLVVRRTADIESLRAVAASLLAEMPHVVGVAASLHDGESPQVLGNETVVLAGTSSAEDAIGASRAVATFGSFVQAHRDQAGRIHELLAKALEAERGPRVLDLYAGSGVIALALARHGADVTCVESFGPAAASIRDAAARSDLKVRAIHSDVASALRTLHEQCARFDAVVANPPRRGVNPAARAWLARLDVPLIAYVSCEPDTLARDIDHLSRLGYRCTHTQPLDMIPLSEEVETVALLRRGAMPPPRVLFETDTALFVDKSAHEPLREHPEHPSSLVARVRALPGAENAVPVSRLEIGASGVALFARTPEHVSAWQTALAASTTRKVYLVGTRGIVPTKGSITRNPESGGDEPARTRYRRLAVFGGHSLVRATPEHGRGHQLERHFASSGHPILGDDRHGHAATNRHFEEKYGLDRPFVHCVRIEVDTQVGERLVVESALPGELATVLVRAGGPDTLTLLEQKNALGRHTSSAPPPPVSR